MGTSKRSKMNYWGPTIFATAVIALSISGCTRKLKVTYDSDPRGAVLYSGRNQQRYGHTPQTLSYPISKEAKKRGYMILTRTRVLWASGASAEVTSLRVDLKKRGLNHKNSRSTDPKAYPEGETTCASLLGLRSSRLCSVKPRHKRLKR